MPKEQVQQRSYEEEDPLELDGAIDRPEDEAEGEIGWADLNDGEDWVFDPYE